MRAQAVTSKSHVRQNRERVDICRQTHLPPLCGLSFPRLLSFAGEANRVAADQQVRRKAVTRRQTEHNLSHLDGIADLFTPIRFQGLGNSANGRFIVGEEFGRVLVRAGTPVRPHSAGFKGANLHPERGQFLGKRFRKASNRPFRCMISCAARSGQSAADRRYLEDAAAPLLAHVRYGRTGDVNDAIEVGVNHRLEPLRTQLLERRNIAEPGVINDHVETPKRVKCYLHGGLSRALIRHVKRNRADALAEFFYQVIKSLRVARRGDEPIAGVEHSLRNIPAQTTGAAGDQPYFVHKYLHLLPSHFSFLTAPISSPSISVKPRRPTSPSRGATIMPAVASSASSGRNWVRPLRLTSRLPTRSGEFSAKRLRTLAVSLSPSTRLTRKAPTSPNPSSERSNSPSEPSSS